MSILSAQTIRRYCLEEQMLVPFSEEKRRPVQIGNFKLDVSYGLGAASYSITLNQDLHMGYDITQDPSYCHNFGLYSTQERFKMPLDVCATVHDKSTWARRGVAVQTTFIDPGWEGWLTLEISYHGDGHILIPVGTGIAQIVFHKLDETTELPYKGKYQNQQRNPQEAL